MAAGRDRRSTLAAARHGVALGYNLTLSPAVELVNELHYSLPTTRSPGRVAFRAGFIATLRRKSRG